MTKHTRIAPPKTLSEIVLADEYLRDDLQDYVDGYETGTVIFYGASGTGKSTLARTIATMTCGENVAEYINATDKVAVRKIEYSNLMSRIEYTKWLTANENFVPTLIIDEVDRLPSAKMDELKALLDTLENNKENEFWHWNVFLTTNHINLVPTAVRSRSREMLIRGLTAQDAVPAVQRILQREDIIESDADVLKQIQNGIAAKSPTNSRIDWRRVIEDCQRKLRRKKQQQAAQTTKRTKHTLKVVK